MDQIDLCHVQRLFAENGKKIYETALETINKYSMQAHLSGGVLLGLSGGADSVMLLLLLLEYKRQTNQSFRLAAMHINHMIRGEDADRDEDFCRRLCHNLGVEFFAEKINVPSLSEQMGIGIEEAARNARYNAFNKIISGRKDINCIAVAHNMGDCAETVIFNILRGCGTKGASGIPPVRDNIVRPLIEASKFDIITALDSYGIKYVTDATNLSTDYTRNYIRHEIIPAMSKICENPDKMLSRFANNLRSDDEYIGKAAQSFLDEHQPMTNRDLLSLDYSLYVRVLSIMANNVGASVSSAIASDIYSNLSKNSFSYSLIGAKFVCDRCVCSITPVNEEEIDYFIPIEDGKAHLDKINADAFISDENVKEIYSNVYNFSIQANLSSAIIKGRLFFRPKMDGDSVYYGGMTHKLKKLFNDRKIPIADRKLIPVLCDNAGVVWVPGFGVRDDGVSDEDKRELFIFIGSNTCHGFFK